MHGSGCQAFEYQAPPLLCPSYLHLKWTETVHSGQVEWWFKEAKACRWLSSPSSVLWAGVLLFPDGFTATQDPEGLPGFSENSLRPWMLKSDVKVTDQLSSVVVWVQDIRSSSSAR